ncbi:DUF3563 family protein [Ideonella azotifigens]|uniref:DUF3563 domain-containing protein n=1 Tax=Ideonella azotifigens TaxID=513160 RepID=A0ABP3VU46_9BURK|nr:DUF3563 family protein [Ideonella azotifigens]MCD2340356.1 DUF3563 family protein [Ideonella azotifigens]
MTSVQNTYATVRRFIAQLTTPSQRGQDASREDDERYLSQAVDMGDLERRIRRLERGTVESAHTQLSMMSWSH